MSRQQTTIDKNVLCLFIMYFARINLFVENSDTYYVYLNLFMSFYKHINHTHTHTPKSFT